MHTLPIASCTQHNRASTISRVKDLPLLEAALAYAADGWPVFPCENKSPLTPTGFHAASTDAEVIKAWWKRWPDAMIGAPTGSVMGSWALHPGSKRRASGPA